jgi:hypothetical protein
MSKYHRWFGGSLGREHERRAAQLAILAGGDELEVGDPAACPLPPDELARVEGDEPFVVQRFSGGLTATVFRLRLAGRDWTLKRARVPCLVQNADGETSFLNEVQRRSELAALGRTPDGARRFSAIVDTQYASLRRGVLLSPWIEGQIVAAWDARTLGQLFDQLVELLLEGFFEWDFSPGNILDDGHQLRLFDFGYMYRFDPLVEPNNNGWESPLFHGIERFETRNYFGFLLTLEQTLGGAAALEALRLEKTLAVAAYQRLQASLRERGAAPRVLDHLADITLAWQRALEGDLRGLYLGEGWRSHRLDVDDDLRGQTCTPLTLARVDWLLTAVRQHFGALKDLQVLFWDDADLSQADLVRMLDQARHQAQAWQVDRAAPEPPA